MTVLRGWVLLGIVGWGCVAQAQETIVLFDGHVMRGLQTLDGSPPPAAWEIVDGELHLKVGAEAGGHLVTERAFQDFRLDFVWKIAPGGNNGIKYRVRDYDGRTLGCEYQLIDDAGYPESLRPQQTTAALYDVFEPAPHKRLHGVGEYNTSTIVVRGRRIEHWLNGLCVVAACVGDSEWLERVAASKFGDVEAFAQNRSGKIMLTDHHTEVWFRSIVLHTWPDATWEPTASRCLVTLSCRRHYSVVDRRAVGNRRTVGNLRQGVLRCRNRLR